jgi:hypothetical protein
MNIIPFQRERVENKKSVLHKQEHKLIQQFLGLGELRLLVEFDCQFELILHLLALHIKL